MECVRVRDVDFFHVSIATFGKVVFCATVFVYIFKSLNHWFFLRVTSHIVDFFSLFFRFFFLTTFPYWDIGSDSSPYLVVRGESVFKSPSHVEPNSRINSGFIWAQFFMDIQADSQWYMMIPDDFMTIHDDSW